MYYNVSSCIHYLVYLLMDIQLISKYITIYSYILLCKIEDFLNEISEYYCTFCVSQLIKKILYSNIKKKNFYNKININIKKGFFFFFFLY